MNTPIEFIRDLYPESKIFTAQEVADLIITYISLAPAPEQKPTNQPEPKIELIPDISIRPQYYNAYPREVIDIMIDIWGKASVAVFCQINAFKYRMRMGLKDNLSEDMLKEQWYLNKSKELRNETER